MRSAHDELITYEVLRSLSKLSGDPIVSVFHPTMRATFHKQQNKNRLKTLLTRSEPMLVAWGLKRKEVDHFLAPARRLLQDQDFWRHRLEGLAVYVARDHFRYYRVPFTLPELVEVSSTACVRPLLPALAAQGHFHVLAISRNLVRLFRATRDDFTELNVKSLGIPSSLAEVLRFDDFERVMQSHATGRAEARLQTHSQAGARAGRHAWHGHGFGDEEVKEELGRFLGTVDAGLQKALAGERAPLVLAAVAYEQDLYRLVSEYPHIAAEGIEGNPDRMSPKELHERAWPIALRSFEAGKDAAKLAYREASNAGEASDDLGEILRAAHEGRVSALLTSEGTKTWGLYDQETSRTETHEPAEPLDTDLIDLAVRQTILHGGEAYLIDPQEMPSPRPIAAVYRY